MHRYFLKTPWILRRLFPHYVWRMPRGRQKVYLSFDDGPQEKVTPWVLDVLKEYDATATFFCIGKNVVEHPGLYQRIIQEGHATGNHTFHHRNGWQCSTEEYLEDVAAAAAIIDSRLFRPPYGRIRSGQANGMAHAMKREAARIIMWDVLSADFDRNFSPQACLKNVVDHTVDGSIIVFHDSAKAFKNLEYCLPRALEWIKSREYGFGRIDELF